jgi:hypothetical protein
MMMWTQTASHLHSLITFAHSYSFDALDFETTFFSFSRVLVVREHQLLQQWESGSEDDGIERDHSTQMKAKEEEAKQND